MLRYLFHLLWKDVPVVVRAGVLALPVIGIFAGRLMITGGYALSQTALVTMAVLLLMFAWIAGRAVWYGYQLTEQAKPRLEVEVNPRQGRQANSQVIQEFTLKIRNAGLGTLVNCTAKVIADSADPGHYQTPLMVFSKGQFGLPGVHPWGA